MDGAMMFIIGSLIFDLAVIIGANLWILSDPSLRQQGRPHDPISQEIDELLEAQTRNT